MKPVWKLVKRVNETRGIVIYLVMGLYQRLNVNSLWHPSATSGHWSAPWKVTISCHWISASCGWAERSGSDSPCHSGCTWKWVTSAGGACWLFLHLTLNSSNASCSFSSTLRSLRFSSCLQREWSWARSFHQSTSMSRTFMSLLQTSLNRSSLAWCGSTSEGLIVSYAVDHSMPRIRLRLHHVENVDPSFLPRVQSLRLAAI